LAEPPSDDARQRLRQCAHDLNNVLGQILGFSSLLVRDVESAHAEGRVEGGVVDYAKELLAAGLRGEVIAKQLAAVIRSMQASSEGESPIAATAPSGGGAAAAAQPRRLLLVGSEDTLTRPMSAAFTDAGWQVASYRSGADALRSFRTGPGFEVVIAHPAAAEIPGTDLVAAIKALSPATTCILILGEGANADETAARWAGADACLARTVTGLTAVAAVEDIARRRGTAV
jgi:CheY-like chemotaxis protein